MRTIIVPVPERAADQLRELARREFRTPKAQACLFILAGLKAAGLDVDTDTRERAELKAGPRP